MEVKYLKLLLLVIWLDLCNSATLATPSKAYNCSYCQPEQIHIAYGAYHCGSEFGWSERFSFKTPPSVDQKKPLRILLFGDLGVANAHSLPYLQTEAEENDFDFAIHVGDFAYDLDDDNARLGDQFMRQIQPIAAILPYMTCVGNHEEKYNFSNYKNRFTMPYYKLYENMFFSWDVGPIHFVSVNAEAYYFPQYGLDILSNQFAWLKKDLTEANKEENRKLRPWIIMYGHRPMYCSGFRDISDCENELTRVGYQGLYPLEPLLKEFGVDIVICGHEHVYERMWPVYNETVYNGSYSQPYVNPGAPVHFISGSAGCREKTDPFVVDPAAWSAFRSMDYGYTRSVVYNATHIHMEQVSVDLRGEVIDSFWVVKDCHGSFLDI